MLELQSESIREKSASLCGGVSFLDWPLEGKEVLLLSREEFSSFSSTSATWLTFLCSGGESIT